MWEGAVTITGGNNALGVNALLHAFNSDSVNIFMACRVTKHCLARVGIDKRGLALVGIGI
jgi:hypothetical protein